MSEGTETPQDLRTRLEAQIEANKGLTSALAAERTARVLASGTYALVKPEDLTGVPVDEIEAKVAALQAERHETQLGLIKDVLRRNGVPDDQLDQQATDMLAGTAAQVAPAPVSSGWGTALSAAQGGEPAPLVDASKLHGSDAIAAGLAALEQKRTRTT